MKYLVVLLVVLIAIWAWRNARHRKELEAHHAAPPKPPVYDMPNSKEPMMPMVRCRHCGLHVPSADAVYDFDKSTYCSVAHRLAKTGR
ncbi:PP0621 family protein [Variovorax sp. KK3]|uniref:PP0621 family protein n=1 Tax=Variovorax sp. KK3 TaxID=1855728 RepID=UPI00097BC172|nr:PP0621 family protein [Variovorax sp. KK3]